MDRHIRDEFIEDHPLLSSKYAFMAGCSVYLVLHKAVTRIKGGILKEEGGFSICNFLDVKGAFCNTSYQIICEEALNHCGKA